jgi:WhiB family redox-sensing transcriptional regulator
LPPGAACAAADPDLFFPSRDEGDEAKAICQGCLIRRECYTLAAQRGEPWGIWGGVNFDVTATRQEARAS